MVSLPLKYFLPEIAPTKVIDKGSPPPIFLRILSAWAPLQNCDNMKFVGFEYCVQSVSWLIQKNPSIIVPTGSPINGGNFNLLVGPTGIEPA